MKLKIKFSRSTRDVRHWTLEVSAREWAFHGNGISTGFPWKWELDLNKDGNENVTTWESERLMLAGPKIIRTD